ncbi:MAG: type I DNA topoisomerase [Planctomycetes bacterium]|nr:type I DNA topoisomerase [Planctomycetota bacterium]
MAKTTKGKSLVIVESPAKAKTINRYLGPDFEVTSSMGHIRDLPSKGINVDIDNGFVPTYDINPGKKRMVNTLKSKAKKCDKLYLATDLDREGEAIAWHLSEILGVDEDRTFRVVFNSITKSAIQKAFENPGKLDMDRVNAQQARRILDRIVGYQISPLLWKKVARGLSAGRVQSVAVKIIVLKEREIQAFVPVEYWDIPAVFTTDMSVDLTEVWQEFLDSAEDETKGRTVVEQYEWLAEHDAFKADLTHVSGKKFSVDNGDDANRVFSALEGRDYKVADLTKKRTTTRPSPPFITSTLQQAAANRLGFTTKRTMTTAQKLYEGLDMGSLGTLGLITYMRTDSTHLSGEALDEVRKHIKNNMGEEYVPEKSNFYASKKGAQEAHEAIRPTDPDITPDDIRHHLSEEQYKLYNLIWRRFVACQMAAAQWDTTTVAIEADTSEGVCKFRANGRVQVFDGFTRIWQNNSNDQHLPAMSVNDPLGAVSIKAVQNFTKPPARYTEASLVKTLEKEGIGRPSTYASIITTIQARKYVEKIQNKFHSTDIGEVVTDKLDEFFPHVMDIAFTRHMEEELDDIADKKLDWVGVLDEFYGPFKKSLDTATEEMKHAKAETQPSEYKCPKCDAPMEYRFGKNGRFLSCTKYDGTKEDSCKYACPCDRKGVMLEPKESEHVCPNCNRMMMHKTGRFGEFLGCAGYPECKTILNLDKDGNVLPPKPPPEPTGVKCHKCKTGEFVIRQSKRGPFMGCNKFPKCRTIVSAKMVEKLLGLQKEGKWPPKDPAEVDVILERKKPVAKKKSAKKKTAKKKAAKKKKA